MRVAVRPAAAPVQSSRKAEKPSSDLGNAPSNTGTASPVDADTMTVPAKPSAATMLATRVTRMFT